MRVSALPTVPSLRLCLQASRIRNASPGSRGGCGVEAVGRAASNSVATHRRSRAPSSGALGYELLNRPPGSCDQRLALRGFLTGINDSVCNKPIRMRCISRVFLYICPFTVLEAYEHRPCWRNARGHEPSRGAGADATLSIHQENGYSHLQKRMVHPYIIT